MSGMNSTCHEERIPALNNFCSVIDNNTEQKTSGWELWWGKLVMENVWHSAGGHLFRC